MTTGGQVDASKQPFCVDSMIFIISIWQSKSVCWDENGKLFSHGLRIFSLAKLAQRPTNYQISIRKSQEDEEEDSIGRPESMVAVVVIVLAVVIAAVAPAKVPVARQDLDKVASSMQRAYKIIVLFVRSSVTVKQ